MSTAVIFRRFEEGDIIALFPSLPCDDSGLITSYQHIGQHSGASPDLIHELAPVPEADYAPLLAELVSVGYDDLDVLEPYTSADLLNQLRADLAGDQWGYSMGLFFDLCGELWSRGIEPPCEWGYSPGAASDPREPDSAFYEPCQTATNDDLLHTGAVLNRYVDRLRRAGLDY